MSSWITTLVSSTLPRAHAQSIISTESACDFTTGKFEATCIPDFLAEVIGFIFGLMGGIFLVLIIISGMQYALGDLAGGKDEAKRRIKFAVLGLIISGLAFFIIDFVITTIAAGGGSGGSSSSASST